MLYNDTDPTNPPDGQQKQKKKVNEVTESYAASPDSLYFNNIDSFLSTKQAEQDAIEEQLDYLYDTGKSMPYEKYKNNKLEYIHQFEKLYKNGTITKDKSGNYVMDPNLKERYFKNELLFDNAVKSITDYSKGYITGGKAVGYSPEEWENITKQVNYPQSTQTKIDSVKSANSVAGVSMVTDGQAQDMLHPGKNSAYDPTRDLSRLGLGVFDLASVALGYTPASVASAVAGLASTTGNFMLDINDPNISTSEAFTRGALNLGIDALSVVGGKGMKIPVQIERMGKAVARLGPLVRDGMLAYGAFAGYQAGSEAWNVVVNKDPKDYTIKDYATFLTAATAVLAVAHGPVMNQKEKLVSKYKAAKGMEELKGPRMIEQYASPSSTGDVISGKVSLTEQPIQLTWLQRMRGEYNTKVVENKEKLANKVGMHIDHALHVARRTPEISLKTKAKLETEKAKLAPKVEKAKTKLETAERLRDEAPKPIPDLDVTIKDLKTSHTKEIGKLNDELNLVVKEKEGIENGLKVIEPVKERGVKNSATRHTKLVNELTPKRVKAVESLDKINKAINEKGKSSYRTKRQKELTNEINNIDATIKESNEKLVKKQKRFDDYTEMQTNHTKLADKELKLNKSIEDKHIEFNTEREKLEKQLEANKITQADYDKYLKNVNSKQKELSKVTEEYGKVKNQYDELIASREYKDSISKLQKAKDKVKVTRERAEKLKSDGADAGQIASAEKAQKAAEDKLKEAETFFNKVGDKATWLKNKANAAGRKVQSFLHRLDPTRGRLNFIKQYNNLDKMNHNVSDFYEEGDMSHSEYGAAKDSAGKVAKQTIIFGKNLIPKSMETTKKENIEKKRNGGKLIRKFHNGAVISDITDMLACDQAGGVWDFKLRRCNRRVNLGNTSNVGASTNGISTGSNGTNGLNVGVGLGNGPENSAKGGVGLLSESKAKCENLGGTYDPVTGKCSYASDPKLFKKSSWAGAAGSIAGSMLRNFPIGSLMNYFESRKTPKMYEAPRQNYTGMTFGQRTLTNMPGFEAMSAKLGVRPRRNNTGDVMINSAIGEHDINKVNQNMLTLIAKNADYIDKMKTYNLIAKDKTAASMTEARNKNIAEVNANEAANAKARADRDTLVTQRRIDANANLGSNINTMFNKGMEEYSKQRYFSGEYDRGQFEDWRKANPEISDDDAGRIFQEKTGSDAGTSAFLRKQNARKSYYQRQHKYLRQDDYWGD